MLLFDISIRVCLPHDLFYLRSIYSKDKRKLQKGIAKARNCN